MVDNENTQALSQLNPTTKIVDDQDTISIKKSCFESIRKPLYAFGFAMISSVFNVSANLLVKKTNFFNSFDNSVVRYVIQFFILFVIAKINKIELLGKSDSRKLLIFRGSISGVGLISLYSSIKLIDPSDAISLFSCNVIFVAILSRIYMKEKFTVLHILAMFIVVCGIFFITQPSFLIPKTNDLTVSIYLV